MAEAGDAVSVTRRAGFTVTLTDALAVDPVESVTVTERVRFPAAVGTHVSVPVSAPRHPGGRPDQA